MILKIARESDREAVAIILIRNGYTVKQSKILGATGKKESVIEYEEK